MGSIQAGMMAGLAMGIVLRDDADARLARAGISAAFLDRWFVGQSVAVRTTPVFDPDLLQSLIAQLQRTGISDEAIEAEEETIGSYLGARIAIDRAERGLSLE
jgi:hypothetical protein